MKEINKGIVSLGLSLMLASHVFAGPTVVGNGDDGRDLEGFVALKEGKIIDARDEAIKMLEKQNVAAVPGLGNLLPELKNSQVYITKKDISTEKLVKLGAFTNDEKGLVYARTFPRAHAATRFFPASRGLEKDQLVNLHIHEALHRALPAEIRENEAIVSDITLSITSPESSFDRVNETVAKYYDPNNKTAPNTVTVSEKKIRKKPAAHSRLNYPSKVGIGFTSFADSSLEATDQTSLPLKNMVSFSSHLYPFGGSLEALGVGIDANIVRTETDSQMGPLGLSARLLVWTNKGFDVEFYGRANLNSLSNEELQNSLLGRDVYKIGMTLAKRSDYFYVANDLEYTADSEVTQTIGNVEYKYEFGSIVAAKARFGAYYKSFHLGGFGEILLADNFKVSGGAFSMETGRNRVVSAGPEIRWRSQQFGMRLYGRYLIDSTKDTDFDFLGDLHGRGVGQGNLGIELNFFL